MNEKAYKTMSLSGALTLTAGIIMIVAGLTTGIITIICGARLLKNKEGLMF